MFEDEIKEIENKIYSDNAEYESIIDTLDFILSEDEQNLRALELKYFALFAAEQYELCIDTCNLLLDVDVNNIDALIFKANSFFRLERYAECEDICNLILNIDPENKDATELKDNASALSALNELDVIDLKNVNDTQEEFFHAEYKPQKVSFNMRFLKFILGVILFILPFCCLYYFHPIKENMSCNKTLKCKITQTFLGNYNRVKFITLSNKYYFAQKTTSPLSLDKIYYNSYPIYRLSNGRKVSPFISFIFQSDSKNKNILYMNRESKKFSDYIQNPRRGYYVRSKANDKNLRVNNPLMGYLLYVILLICLMKIFKIMGTIFSSVDIKKHRIKAKKEKSLF